jgi:hypothetical protein
MTDYVSFLLETGAAKRRLAELFESDGLEPVNHLSKAMVARDQNRVARSRTKQKKKLLQNYRSTQRSVLHPARTAIPNMESSQIKRDLTVSGFVLALVSVGVVLAAHTDQPVFWLLVGPTPLAVLHTVRTFLRQRVVRQEGLLTFCERDR